MILLRYIKTKGENIKMNIGQRIKTLRELNEMSQEELGERIGVKRAAVQKYEKGTVENIPLKTIEKISDIFDVSPNYLVGWTAKEDSLSNQTYIVKGVKSHFGQRAFYALQSFTELNKDGQLRALQYLEELTKIYSAEDHRDV